MIKQVTVVILADTIYVGEDIVAVDGLSIPQDNLVSLHIEGVE